MKEILNTFHPYFECNPVMYIPEITFFRKIMITIRLHEKAESKENQIKFIYDDLYYIYIMKEIDVTVYIPHIAYFEIEGYERGTTMFYEEESRIIREIISSIPGITIVEGDLNDHEEWVKWEFSTMIGDITVPFIIEHFKSRVIMQVTFKIKSADLRTLFKESRILRSKVENFLENKDSILDLERRAEEYIKKNPKIKSLEFYKYYLIEIEKDYRPKYVEQINKELRTTFFYEIIDPYPRTVIPHRNYGILRVSRPSIITTKMSKETISRLLQAIYHSCLHKMREKRIRKIDEEIFGDMRNFIEDIFYRKQAEASQIDERHFVSLLTIIAGMGSIAAVLGLVYVLPYYWDESYKICEYVKSMAGMLLLLMVFIVGILFVMRSHRSIKY